MEKKDPHDLLVAHLTALALEANSYEFHDFKNGRYPAPKTELIAQLENIIRNTKDGLYDN